MPTGLAKFIYSSAMGQSDVVGRWTQQREHQQRNIKQLRTGLHHCIVRAVF